MRRLLVILAALILTACSTPATFTDSSGSYNNPKLAGDRAECNVLARRAYPPDGSIPIPIPGRYGREDFYNDCMLSKGHRIQNTGQVQQQPQQRVIPPPSTSGLLVGETQVNLTNGRRVTCAGDEVMAFPVNKYTIKNMEQILAYSKGGNLTGVQMLDLMSRGLLQFNPANAPDQSHMVKTAKCDGQGKFNFGSLEAGDYYIIAVVTYGKNPTDAVMMFRRATIKANGVTEARVIY